jgi:membrane protein YqaA with SNARE-associated domain
MLKSAAPIGGANGFRPAPSSASAPVHSSACGCRPSIGQTQGIRMGSWNLAALTTPVLYVVSYLVALLSGLIPFVINIEAYLIAVAAIAHASPVPMVGTVTAGQMTAKLILYLSGSGALKLKFVRKEKMAKASAAFEKYHNHSTGVVALSSIVGLPPIYGVALLAGALRFPLLRFMVVATLGRIIRFGAVYMLPGLFHHAK